MTRLEGLFASHKVSEIRNMFTDSELGDAYFQITGRMPPVGMNATALIREIKDHLHCGED